MKNISEIFPTESYQRIIATKEMANGNDSIGSMWNETKSFDKSVPIEDIVKWADGCCGKLIITLDEDTIKPL